MYTECPECGVAFRVTAKVLQQAKGNVRCGGCSHAFNALEFLSEEMPSNPQPDVDNVSDDDLAETSRRLLITLDELAGPNEVRIEDTGVEWRVLEEDLTSDEAGNLEPPGERRYDDNSPLPDDFDEGAADTEDEDALVPQTPESGTPIEFTESPQDVALSEPEEWTDLLDEVRDEDADGLTIDEVAEDEADPDPDDSNKLVEAVDQTEKESESDEIQEMESEVLQIEQELAALHTQLLTGDSEKDPDVDDAPADIDTQFNLQADELGLATIASSEALTDEVPILNESSAIEDEEDGRAIGADSTDEDRYDESVIETDNEDADESIDAEDEPGVDQTEEEFDHDDADGPTDAEIGASSVDAENGADDIDLAADIEAAPDGADESRIDSEEESIDDADELSYEEASDEHFEETTEENRESTSEFEAQIEVAASAFAEGDDESEEIESSEFESSEEDHPVADGIDNNDISLDFLALENQVANDGDAADDVVSNVDELDADEATGETEHFVPELTEEEMSVNMEIDQEMMAMALQDDEFSATLVGMATPDKLTKDEPEDVEAIVMEGEFVRSAVEQERTAAEEAARGQLDDATSFSDTHAQSHDKLRGGRRSYDPPAYTMIVGVAALGLLLAIQFIHYSRETLATSGFFNQTIGAVYRVFGNPITPEWDIKGWQFEATNGSIGAEENSLVIVSQLSNQSDSALPYPLVHVSLTDRWEDIMGSRILEPGEYLAGALDSTSPVQPGQEFTAVITIDNPVAEATGFKLNVCYRHEPGVVRCAIEDFK